MNFSIGKNSSQSWSIPCTRKRASLIQFGRFSTLNARRCADTHESIHDIVPPDKCKIMVNDTAHIAMYSDPTTAERASHIFKSLMKSGASLRGKSNTQSYKINSSSRKVIMGMFIMMISLQQIGGNSTIEVPRTSLVEIGDIMYVGYRLYSFVDVVIMDDVVRIKFTELVDLVEDSFLVKMIQSYKNIGTIASCCELPLFYKQVLDEIYIVMMVKARYHQEDITAHHHNSSSFRATSPRATTPQSPKHWGPPTQTVSQQY